MKLKACERCGKRTAEGLALCPDCMKESGAAAEAVAAAEELRDIARVLSITALRGCFPSRQAQTRIFGKQ